MKTNFTKSFVAPIILVGLTALSVEIKTKSETPVLRHAKASSKVPKHYFLLLCKIMLNKWYMFIGSCMINSIRIQLYKISLIFSLSCTEESKGIISTLVLFLLSLFHLRLNTAYSLESNNKSFLGPILLPLCRFDSYWSTGSSN